MTDWEPDTQHYNDDAHTLEQIREDDAEQREQARRDRVTRDAGERAPVFGRKWKPAPAKTCGVCGRRYWSAAAHWESCTGRAA